MESRLEERTASESPRATTERLVDDLKELLDRAQERAAERAKAADKIIRDHPYHTIGLAFGLGLLIGVLSRRR